MTSSPLDDLLIVAYDKTRHRTGWIGAPKRVLMVPRHNQQPTGSITLAGDDEKIRLLQQPGARVACWYRGEYILGGMIRGRGGEGSTQQREVTFQVEDDWRVLKNILAWQVPGAATTAQNTAEYRKLAGPAETVAKTLLAENITRLGLGSRYAVATSLGRGATINVAARMVKPSELLLPALDQAGIGLTVRPTNGPESPDQGLLVIDAYAPSVYPRTLSEESGTLAEQGWSQTPPEVTRVVLGFEGDGTARQYRGPYINAAAESAWGDVIEEFVDARDLKTTESGFTALAAERANQRLAEGAAKAGLSVTLNESETFRYGGAVGVHVGDQLTVDVAEGVTITDVLREANLSLGQNGLQVTPTVGERQDDPTAATMRAVSALATRVRALGWRK